MSRKQCKLCPWKVTTDPLQIPDGYDVQMHGALQVTIAKPGGIELIDKDLRIMACHETQPGRELPCVGWLDNQLNEGNNLALRFAVFNGRISADYELDGPQHKRFEDTLPKSVHEVVADPARYELLEQDYIGLKLDCDRCRETRSALRLAVARFLVEAGAARGVAPEAFSVLQEALEASAGWPEDNE